MFHMQHLHGVLREWIGHQIALNQAPGGFPKAMSVVAGILTVDQIGCAWKRSKTGLKKGISDYLVKDELVFLQSIFTLL